MFNKLIGQKEVKSQLGFYADLHNAGYVVPPIMLNAAKGLGKTAFATAFHKETNKSSRKFKEVNCGTIRNAEQFFDQFFIPEVMGQEVTVLFDECHALPKDVTNIFLTAFNVEGAKKKLVNTAQGAMEFDFEKQMYLFATTELHKLFDPLKDRLTMIDFKQYDELELGRIMKEKIDWISYKDDVMTSIVSCLKGNARGAVKMALKIQDWCHREKISSICHVEWAKMKNHFNIMPFGLTNTEVQILRALNKRGACSLQMLSAITGMSRQAIQREAENNLLRKGFMDIDGKRKITAKGTQILEQIK
jgi:Holliday junction DNA helicase RuvB